MRHGRAFFKSGSPSFARVEGTRRAAPLIPVENRTMRKISDSPLIYQREDGTYIRFLVYQDDEPMHGLHEVTETIEHCLNSDDGYSRTAARISIVDDATCNEFASLCRSPTHECDNCGRK